jgi:hypothetical protein
LPRASSRITLTEHAFTINMELGVLVAGSKLSAQVQEHFDRLIVDGMVTRVKAVTTVTRLFIESPLR